MFFNYGTPLPLSDITLLPPVEFRADILRNVNAGWRILGLFGLPENDECALCAVLASEEQKKLYAVRTEPIQRYQALTPDCPQAHLFEREVFEQWHVIPEGHPWLKPVRFSPSMKHGDSQRPGPGQMDFYKVRGQQVHEVAVGPIHAGVIEPGHFRFQCHGENVLFLEISLGYQHRGIEKLLHNGPDVRTRHLIECAAGDSSIAHATAYALLIESLSGTHVPPRAHLLRRLALELERLANHTGDLGALAGDTGFLPTSAWNGRIRGDFLNMTAALCGNRFRRNFVSPGGTTRDLTADDCRCLEKKLQSTWKDVRGSVNTMMHSNSVLARLANTGTLSRITAQQLGLVGVAARACGLALDSRLHFPASSLPSVLRHAKTRHTGDVLARAQIRDMEIEDSARQALADLRQLAETDAGEVYAKPAELLKNHLAVGMAEGWRGEVCHIAITGPNGRFLTYKIIDPSFHNWQGLAVALRGEQISDFPLCNKSFNLSYCGHDL